MPATNVARQGDAAPGLFYVPYLSDRDGLVASTRSGSHSPGFPTPDYVRLAAGLAPSRALPVHHARGVSLHGGGAGRSYSVRVSGGAVRVASQLLGSEVDRDVATRGMVTAWSSKSRMRMVETMASLDWGPVLEPDRPGWRACMITLTLPGDWLAVAPDGPAFKAIMHRFRCRWERKWGPVSWVWKLEFQRRGAPHLHIYTAAGHDREFRDWLSLAWTNSIFRTRARGASDRYGDEWSRSLNAGAGIDWGEGIRASDPKRLAAYFLKRATGHNLGHDKEYQHYVPLEWSAGTCPRGVRCSDCPQPPGPGRFWGYAGLDVVREEVSIHPHDFIALRRLMRRWSRANGRPLSHLGASRMIGGMVLANDAPGWLMQACRWLDASREDRRRCASAVCCGDLSARGSRGPSLTVEGADAPSLKGATP